MPDNRRVCVSGQKAGSVGGQLCDVKLAAIYFPAPGCQKSGCTRSVKQTVPVYSVGKVLSGILTYF
jgi:hypothetical protein